ncbi:MAG TPA: ATP-binding protein, partial [Candidatus Methylomirabilis sp.]|nr:ATP-binding protein [Candidatus Methylomirabilis sp.]
LSPSLRVGESLTGQVAQEGRPIAVADLREDRSYLPEHKTGALAHGVVSYLGVPLRYRNRLIGVLNVYGKERRVFHQGEVALLSAFADQAAIAIQNARLFAEAKEHSEHLEERVRARTAELEEANRAKSQFLANMSHELRTPLNSIIGFSALLEEGGQGPLTEKQAHYVTNIHTSGKHLLAVINDILDLTKVEAGKLELTLGPVDLGEVIRASLTLVRGLAAAKRLSLTSELPEALPLAIADPVRLQQILFNLLSNAVKFTPAGGAVTVGVERREEDLAVWVRDTGIGIAPEDQERIFREFEQVDNSFARQYQGTGLGLALARKLVELHGGRIHVESALAKGSTFTFTLPKRVPGDLPAMRA